MTEKYSFPENELEDSLRRAFVEGKADFIIMDGWNYANPFLKESIKYGTNEKLIQRGEDLNEDDILGKGMGQYLAHTFRLTETGKKHFKL